MLIPKIVPVLALLYLVGCTEEYNHFPTASEGETITHIDQLTTRFVQAGQAQFSPDMQWLAFAARPHDEAHDQIYLAPVNISDGHITGIGMPIRVTPSNSANASPAFSPTGLSLIFSSTGFRAATYSLPPDEPGKKFLGTMQIFRVDGWESAVSGLPPGGRIDLAQHPITNGTACCWEAVYSPDGKRINYTVQPVPDDQVGDDQPEGVAPEIYEMNADGSDAKLVAHNTTVRQQLTDFPPPLHPSFDRERQSYLVGASDRWASGQWHLQAMLPDGNHKTRVTFLGNFNFDPSFSPDQHFLVWTSGRTSDHSRQLFVAEFRRPPGL